MASCLGLYIEDNLIKYAKVSKEKDDIKVDAYGMKFYEDINRAIKQIVEETFSFKTPISVNLINEMYNYFDMFSLLTKKDLQNSHSDPNLNSDHNLQSLYVFRSTVQLFGCNVYAIRK